jgi:glutamyl-tRNA synthetase
VRHTDRFQQASFYHHSLLAEKGGKKLSKSAGDTSVRYLRGEGKKPGDIYSAIATMLGYDVPVKDWKQLAGLIYRGH